MNERLTSKKIKEEKMQNVVIMYSLYKTSGFKH